MDGDKRIRLHSDQQRLVISALLRLARDDKSKVWDCWLIARSLGEETKGKRPRWQGRRDDRMLLEEMERWSGKFETRRHAPGEVSRVTGLPSSRRAARSRR